jgi:subtilisin family serine protease
MRRSKLLLVVISSALLFSSNLPALVAKENSKPTAKEKVKDNSQATPKTGNTPTASKNESSSAKVENTKPAQRENAKPAPSESTKPAQNENVKVEKSANPSKAETSQKSEVVEKKNNNNAATETVEEISSAPTGACKSAANAKKKVAQNLCYDFIVVFKPEIVRGNSDKLLKDSGAQKLREFSNVFNGALVNGPLAKMQALAKNPNVLVVEDDLDVKITTLQSPAPWGLDRIDQGALPLNQSFDDRDESGLNSYAYVVDTGIDVLNVDFEGRVSGGFTAVLDGRGAADCNGHGTHVAGTIAGRTYGVAKKATLVPVRVLDCAGSGSYSSVISGLDWIAANHPAGTPAIVNMSLGGPASSTLDGAIRNLILKGITVVVAAGNSAADACNYSPARVTEAITVAATTISDVRASYSNFGSCVDIFAPGSEITSTWLGSTAVNTISGTSMAAPHVAGTLARFLTKNPTLTPGQAANSLLASATTGAVLSGGTNSPNKLLYLYLIPDTTTAVPVDTSPTFKKVIPRGKKR